jgi:hypothetical protein
MEARLDWPQSQSGRCGDENNLALPGIEPGPSSPSLYQLSYPYTDLNPFKYFRCIAFEVFTLLTVKSALLQCNAVVSGIILPPLLSNILPPSSGSKLSQARYQHGVMYQMIVLFICDVYQHVKCTWICNRILEYAINLMDNNKTTAIHFRNC